MTPTPSARRRAADRRGPRHARLAARRLRPARRARSAAARPLRPGRLRAAADARCSSSTELHERKSGAGIVAKLFELAGGHGPGRRLPPPRADGRDRPGLHRRAEPPRPCPGGSATPGRSSATRRPRPGRLREFQQVGVERLGDAGPVADAEVIWLADWALAEAGVADATIRLGHVGLILEMLERSGLPAPLAVGPDRDAQRGRRRGARRPGARARASSSSPAGSRPARAGRDPRRGRAGRRRRDRPALPDARPGRHRPAVGARDRPPAAAEVGPRPRPARRPGAGPRARSTTWPT